MKKLTICDVINATGGKLVLEGSSPFVGKFSIDSRTICSGDIFIAVKGNNFNGHDFVKEALSKGASGIISERPPSSDMDTSGRYFVVVSDSIKAMADVAAKIRRSSDMPVICITGTNGKTTVKDMVASALSSRYKVLKSRNSYNNIFGVCLTLFEMEMSHTAAVLEVGTNSPGEIAYLAGIIAPNMVVITNIGRGHLEAFLNRRGVFDEKISILRELSVGGVAVLNGDDEMLSSLRPEDHRVLFYGSGDNCDIRVSGIKSVSAGTEFFVDGKKFLFSGEGRHNVYNAAAAIAVAKNLNVESSRIRETIEKIVLPSMRLEKVSSGGIVFLNDAYNANPGSFEAAVETLAATSSSGEKWVVAGDMLELGDASGELHRELGRKIASLRMDFLITLGDMGGEILAGARDCGMGEDRTYAALSHCDAAEKISERASAGSTVLVKGSRVMKMEEVIKCFITCCTR